MNGLLIIGTACIIAISLLALIASIGDWKIARAMQRFPTIPRRRAAVAVVIYHTTISETLRSVATLHALALPHVSIIIVDNATLGNHAHAFRAGLRQLYHHPIRLYVSRTPTSRRAAILAAIRYIPARQPIVVIDGGDIVTGNLMDLPSSASLRQLGRVLQWPRSTPLGPSFAETAITLGYSARHFFTRARHALWSSMSNSLPAGTVYADSRALRRPLRLQPLHTPLPTTRSPLPHTTLGLAALLAAALSLLAILSHVAYLAASLQTVQPLLVFGLLSLFAVSVLILWDPTTRLVHKAQLLFTAPLSGLILPVSLLLLTGQSLVQKIQWSRLRFWQLLTRTRHKHS